MSALEHIYCDGGRAAAGFKGDVNDCSTRAIAIATGIDYLEVYNKLNAYGARCKLSKRHPKPCRARTGVCKKRLAEFFADLGWRWTPTMSIGSGTTVHLAEGELPAGRLVAQVTKHICAVIDGVIYDTHDPSRDGTRAVFGYWQPKRQRLVA